MHRHGVNVLLRAQTLAAIDPHAPSGAVRQGVADPEMGDQADLVIVVGGDGSLLGFGREMAARRAGGWRESRWPRLFGRNIARANRGRKKSSTVSALSKSTFCCKPRFCEMKYRRTKRPQ